jgi:uncharacterized SAM-binding protein YcdF (DUF218 family)
MHSLDSRTREHVEALWRFHARSDDPPDVNAIVCLGSYDLRVAERTAELAAAHPDAVIVVTGSYGNWTRGIFEATEAEIFGRVLVDRGVPSSRITLETKAANIGENIAFTRDLLGRRTTGTALFVTKPQTQMRVRATIPVQWPEVSAAVTAPRLSIEDYRSPEDGLTPLINEMVGDLQRMLAYPALGFQVRVEVPPDAMAAFEFLKSAGFTRHLMPATA